MGLRRIRFKPFVLSLISMAVSIIILSTLTHQSDKCSYDWRIAYDANASYKKPKEFAKAETFHMIGRQRGNKGRPCILVYSAYFDIRDNAVKVVSNSERSCNRYATCITCQIWYESAKDPYVSRLTFSHHMDDEETSMRLGIVYYCNANSSMSERPYALTLSSNDGTDSANSMSLSMRIYQPRLPKIKFAVCVPPLFGDIRPESLLQFIEMHRLLGAERFYLYNEDASDEVERLLQAYQKMGIAEVMQWRTDYPDPLNYHNQNAMQEDCLLRNQHQTIYVAQMDVDEVLLPADGMDWHELVKRLERNETGSFTFLNRFFSVTESRQCSQAAFTYGPTFSKFVPKYMKRLQFFNVHFEPGERSKLIYRPERVEQARVHEALLRPGYQNVVVNYSDGALNHYRDPPPLTGNRDLVVDRSMCRYSGVLAQAIRDAVDSAKGLTAGSQPSE